MDLKSSTMPYEITIYILIINSKGKSSKQEITTGKQIKIPNAEQRLTKNNTSIKCKTVLCVVLIMPE